MEGQETRVNKKNDPKSLAMIISSMLVFGSIGVFRRYIPASSAFLACSRGLLGGLFIFVFLKLIRRGDKATAARKTAGETLAGESPAGESSTGKSTAGQKLAGRQIGWLIFTGILIGINWILLFEAFNQTTVPIATLCYYMQPTIIILLSPLVFKEKLTRKKAICAAVAIIGMVLVSGVVGDSNGATLRGVMLGLGAAVFYATVVMLNKKLRGIDAFRKTMIQLLAAGACMIPYMLLTGGIGETRFTTRAVILMLIVGIVHTGIAYVAYFASMDGLKIQSIALLSYIDPVSALFFSAIFLKEPLSALGIIGAVMIIGSAIISETGGAGS